MALGKYLQKEGIDECDICKTVFQSKNSCKGKKRLCGNVECRNTYERLKRITISKLKKGELTIKGYKLVKTKELDKEAKTL